MCDSVERGASSYMLSSGDQERTSIGPRTNPSFPSSSALLISGLQRHQTLRLKPPGRLVGPLSAHVFSHQRLSIFPSNSHAFPMPTVAPGSHAWIISSCKFPASRLTFLSTGHPASFFFSPKSPALTWRPLPSLQLNGSHCPQLGQTSN